MKKKVIVLQDELSDCGVSCLLSIIRYYGGDANIEALKLDSLTTEKGVTALNLIRCANKCGFDAKGVRVKNIENINLPCIAHVINDGVSHFIVVYEIHENYLLVMDPAKGLIKLSNDIFNKIFTGDIIKLEVKDSIINQKSNKTIEKQIFKELIKRKKVLLLIIVLNIIFIVLSIFYSSNINVFLNYNSSWFFILFFVILFLVYGIDYLIKLLSVKLSKDININLLRKFIDNIFFLPLKYVRIKASSEIIKRTDDLESVKELIKECIISLILNTLIIASISIVIGFINIKLLLIVLVFIIIYPFIVYIFSRNLKRIIGYLIVDTTNYKNVINDMVNGLRSINHCNGFKYAKNKIDYNLIKYCDSTYNYDKYIYIINFINSIIIGVFELLINIYLVQLVKTNSLLIENIIFINMLINIMVSSLISITNGIPILSLIKKVLIKINEYYDIISNNRENISFVNGDIVYKNIYYKFNNYNTILDNVNFTIKEKEKILIKGASGSGKSSLCKMLYKELDNYDGDITIGNFNLRNIFEKSLRDNISFLSQNEILFEDTLKNNILLGRTVSSETLDNIIKVCCLDNLISKKPFGIDTLLIGGGEELSGGEKQLIILARMLLIKKSIIILDEALSMVSIKLENTIVNNILNCYKDSTIIYISHRECKLFKKVLCVDKKGVKYGIK